MKLGQLEYVLKSTGYIYLKELQEICDRDEVMKVEYCVCPICGEADAIYDSWDNLNDFCGRCGQRLMKGE